MDYWVQTNKDMNPVLVTGVSDAEMSGIVKLLKSLASDGELVELTDSDGNTIYDNYEQWRSVNSSKRTFTKYTSNYVRANYYDTQVIYGPKTLNTPEVPATDEEIKRWVSRNLHVITEQYHNAPLETIIRDAIFNNGTINWQGVYAEIMYQYPELRNTGLN